MQDTWGKTGRHGSYVMASDYLGGTNCFNLLANRLQFPSLTLILETANSFSTLFLCSEIKILYFLPMISSSITT